ncbi:DnaJ subfamily C member 11 [Grifola frondosa]|uniref:DnaJ subfamily C member 11 n=1 Tax=Grifola frondosa TaxID=5627 RepID=A0A1C7MKJ5_GRIFR|nr:DnaJ subfamily C member 11 [Grifola frondosa]
MPGDPFDVATLPGSADNREFLYAVLNLPTTASDYEIRERYRQLSVLFHPDKQSDSNTKDTAAKRFLEVQKAYQVLSDPVTRRAYDILGQEGLAALSSGDFNGLSGKEFEEALKLHHRTLESERLEGIIRPRGSIVIGLDASSLFDSYDSYSERESWPEEIKYRFEDIKQDGLTVRHSIQKSIAGKTSLTLTGRAKAVMGAGGTGNLMGTVRHQYSPRLSFEATSSLLRASQLDVKTTYRDVNNTVIVKSNLSRSLLRAFSSSSEQLSIIPPTVISLSRRLFPKSNTTGSFVTSVSSGTPLVTLSVSSAEAFDHSLEGYAPSGFPIPEPLYRAPSKTGLSLGTTYWNVGLMLAGGASSINGEYGLVFAELGAQVKVVLQLGFMGMSWFLNGEWRNEEKTVGASVGLSLQGVVLRLDLTYLGQQLSLPVILSHEHNSTLALWTAVVPSTAMAVAYFFALKPRRRRERTNYFRKARRELQEERSDLLRQTKETISLLQDPAKRHMQTEAACDGLIILEASYGPSERDENTEGLDVDVAIPVQALVNKSQLFIPGRRSKRDAFYACDYLQKLGLCSFGHEFEQRPPPPNVTLGSLPEHSVFLIGPSACHRVIGHGLCIPSAENAHADVYGFSLFESIEGLGGAQGFYDPVAGVSKTLRIRYTFRGRMHYAEFPDYVPIVLPLEADYPYATSPP